ncbi:MAG: type II toxin-antitoxin system VapB family antitoxin [Mycobacteriales bacterium]
MSRTVIDIDDAALVGAMAELGTTTKVETVNRALREITDQRRRLDLLAALDATDLEDPEVMAGAWR